MNIRLHNELKRAQPPIGRDQVRIETIIIILGIGAVLMYGLVRALVDVFKPIASVLGGGQ